MMKEKICENLQVVVLMGGLGSRLKERTRDCPKSLIEIDGKPFFEYQLELMILAGFQRFLFCIGYRADAVQSYFGDGRKWGVQIKYSCDGETLLGTGGAIRKALPFLEDDFLLIYGDSFMDVNYFEIAVRYRQAIAAGKKALMAIMRNQNHFDTSNVIYKKGNLLLYDKRKHDSRMEYIDYGISVFQRDTFAKLPSNQYIDLADIQHCLSTSGLLEGCEVEHRFYEIGTPKALEEFTYYANMRWNRPNKAVFLDRDGVINSLCWNEDIEQLDSPLKQSDFSLLPKTVEALKILQDKEYLLFIVTNQPAAAKGKTTFAKLCGINRTFVQDMQQKGIGITDIAMCPHFERKTPFTREAFLVRECNCRKPKTGLIEDIVSKYNIDIQNSWMVGDSATDVLCGKAAGLHTAFIGKFKCDLCMMTGNQKPEIVCSNLYECSKRINT